MKKLVFLLSCVLCFSLQAQSEGPQMGPYEDLSETGAVRPTQPASRILRSVTNRNISNSDDNTSSAGLFEDMSLDYSFVFTDFDDDLLGGSGEVQEHRIGLTSELNEDTSLSLSYSNIQYSYTASSPDAETFAHGLELFIHHDLTENYGVGGYIFYQDVDVERFNGNSYTYGGGFIFTTYHDLDFAYLSTATTVSQVDFDTGDDTVLVLVVDLSRPINDHLEVGIFSSFTDSFESHDIDSTYWSVGTNLNWFYNEYVFSLAYETTQALDNYEDDTVLVNVNYKF